jgi:hypothetical protein
MLAPAESDDLSASYMYATMYRRSPTGNLIQINHPYLDAACSVNTEAVPVSVQVAGKTVVLACLVLQVAPYLLGGGRSGQRWDANGLLSVKLAPLFADPGKKGVNVRHCQPFRTPAASDDERR